MVGIFLVLIGLVWLLNALGVISTTIANVIWPIILIAVGLWLVTRRGRMGGMFCDWKDKDEK